MRTIKGDLPEKGRAWIPPGVEFKYSEEHMLRL